MYAICNAWKHAEDKIASKTMPSDASATIWITNRGIECSEACVSFREFEERLDWVRQVANDIAEFKLKLDDTSKAKAE